MAKKIDSNITGLRYAEEEQGSLGTLPAAPVWIPMEPNSYGEFGPQVNTVARNPITPSRQRKKGVVTDLDATAGFQNDFVQKSMFDLMKGFLFADWRSKPEATPSAVTATSYTVGSAATSFQAGDILFAEGLSESANNGIKVVTSTTSTKVSVTGLEAEPSPPAEAKLTKVGAEAAIGDLAVDASGAEPKLTSTTTDFTTLGLIPGEWLFIGGDDPSNRFASADNNGFARVKNFSANEMTLDRQPGVMVSDDGSGRSVRLFFGHVIKNESDPALIKTRSYQMERSLGTAGYEYVKGCVANTMEIKVTTADKVTVDLGFVGIDAEYQTTAQGPKPGTRPAVPAQDAFNSSSDFSRLRMLNEDTGATLFTYLTELTLTVNNNVSPSKAVGVLGAFDVTAGDFVAAGSVTAYFTSADAVRAVRENDDMSLDFAMVKDNAGWLFDVPLVSIGDGRPSVEKDTEIKLPITLEGAEHPTLRHSLLAVSFTYLPTIAE